MGPARVPALINTPWTHFSAKEMRVRGGPANIFIMKYYEIFSISDSPDTQVA